jgi:two-component system KDP operon response regulator KdpE
MSIRVLAIDDDPALTELLPLLLQPSGIEVKTANSGAEGLQMLQKEDADVVLLDLMMPEMDGWEVCRRIRNFSAVPILILSALDTPGVVAKALDMGADDYLVKPVPSDVLSAHIRNLARRVTGELRPDALRRSSYLPKREPLFP